MLIAAMIGITDKDASCSSSTNNYSFNELIMVRVRVGTVRMSSHGIEVSRHYTEAFRPCHGAALSRGERPGGGTGL